MMINKLKEINQAISNWQLAKYKFILSALAVVAMLSSAFATDIASSATEKRASSMQLSYYKKSDLSKIVVAAVRGKNTEGKFFPVRHTNVSFYIQDKNGNKFLDSALTDMAGKATIALPKNMPLEENHFFTISSKMENNSVYEDVEEKIHFKDAGFSVSLDPADSTHLVTATLLEIGEDGNQTPVKGVEVKFYLQRLFGVMPALEDNTVTTNENGKAEFSFPADMKGDESGNITVVAKIEDNELYGNVESKAGAKWGAPVIVEKNPFPRALWEPTAPYPLIITIAVLFGGVWTTYSIIFFTLYKIKKAGKATS